MVKRIMELAKKVFLDNPGLNGGIRRVLNVLKM